MEEEESRRLKLTLFNSSKSIPHVHVFGESGSGRSEIVRQVLQNCEEDWICAFGDFLYGDGSLKLLLESLARELNVKTKGDKIEDFFRNIYEMAEWRHPEDRKLIIFLDHAQAVVNYQPLTMRSFFNSHKAVPRMTVRFVTCAPSCWETYQAHISLGHLPIVQFHIKYPTPERSIQLIQKCDPSLDPQWVRLAVNTLSPHCKSPNTLLEIIHEVHRRFENQTNFEVRDACDKLMIVAKEKIGISRSTEITTSSSSSSDTNQSFESMPLAMRYLLVATYCASNNAPATDKRFFVKNHGREKRSEKGELQAEVTRHFKDAEPKAADLQRIVCIFEKLVQLNHEVPIRGFDVKNVISSLNSMGLVTTTSLSNLDMPKIKCLISLESVQKVARSLRMELHYYLEFPN